MFAGENELHEETNFKRPSKRSNVVPSEQSSRLGKTQSVKDSEDSAIFRPYARRNRSKINRDSARSNLADLIQGRGSHNSSLPARGFINDGKGSICEPNIQKCANVSSLSNTKQAASNGDLRSKVIISNDQFNVEQTGLQGAEIPGPSKGDTVGQKLDTVISKNMESDQHCEFPQFEAHYDSRDLVPEGQTENEQGVSTEVTEKAEVETHTIHLKGFSDSKKEKRSMPNGQDSFGVTAANGINSYSSSTQNSLILDVNNITNPCFDVKSIGSKRRFVGETAELQGMGNLATDQNLNNRNDIKAFEEVVLVDDNGTVDKNNAMNDFSVKLEDDRRPTEKDICLIAEEVPKVDLAACKANGAALVSKVDRKDAVTSVEVSSCKNFSSNRSAGTLDGSTCEFSLTNLPGRHSDAVTVSQPDSGNLLKLKDEAREDSILEEAQIIEVILLGGNLFMVSDLPV